MKKNLVVIGSLLVSILATAQKSDSVLLFDGFDDNKNNWPVDLYGKDSIKLTDGKLIFKLKKEGRCYNVIPFTYPPNKNISVSASVKYVQGGKNIFGSGLCFGYEKYGNNCSFTITTDGFYQVISIINGEFMPWEIMARRHCLKNAAFFMPWTLGPSTIP